jgi:hypothetical protein
VDYLLRKRDRMSEFRAAPREQQYQIVASAIDKAPRRCRRESFSVGLIEDNMIADEQVEARAKAALVRGGSPVACVLDELESAMDYSGRRDPLTSSVAVAEFAMQKLHEHLHDGLETLPADILKDAGVNADGGAITLSRDQAKITKIFEAAQSMADQRGVELLVEAPGEQPRSVPTNSNGSGNAN